MTWVKGKNTNALVRVRNDDPDLSNRIAESKSFDESIMAEDDEYGRNKGGLVKRPKKKSK